MINEAINFQNVQKKLRLFCFPYAGSSAVVTYKYFSDVLPKYVEVCPVELPGRGSRMSEKLVDNMNDILLDILETIGQSIHEPYIFFGHSMGALISYELTNLFIKKSLPLPLKLYLSAHRAPFAEKDGPIMHKLNNQEFIKELISMKGVAQEILDHSELLNLVLPIIRNDYKLCETYSYKPHNKIDIPITVFGGKFDKDIEEEHLLQWSELTNSNFSSFLFDGDHFFILKRKEKVTGKLINLLNEDIIRLSKKEE